MTKDQFLEGVDGDHHRVLLWLALDLTKVSALPVAELGAGYGSTPFLRQYCSDAGRKFLSWDNNKEWAEQWGAEYIDQWGYPKIYGKHSVVLIDQSPGDCRKDSAKILFNDADILVIHDAEPQNRNSYQLDLIYPLFRYKIFTRGDKIWTVALSNHINLSQYENTIIHNQKIEILNE